MPSELTPAAARRRISLYCTGTFKAFKDFCETCVFITGGDEARGTAVIPFRMWPAQEELAKALCDPEEDEVIVAKPRQIGATWVILAWYLFQALFREMHEYRITSVGEDEAAKALRRVKFMIDHLPPWCMPTLEVENTTTIKIAETGSWINALPSTRNSGRGDTLNSLLCDEAAYQIYSKLILESARPALEKRRGKLLVVSTMESGTHFSELYVNAQGGKNGYRPFFFPWTADPNRTQEWYDRQLEENGQEFMSKTYPRTWQESLLAVSRPYFDQGRTEEALDRVEAPFEDGFVDMGAGGYVFSLAREGPVRVWRRPERDVRYIMFADVAEGLEDGDWDNAYVMAVRGREKEIVARVRGKMPVGEYADILMAVGEWYSSGDGEARMPALLAIEANNHGIAVTEACAKATYRNLYQERNLMTMKFTGRIGWMTSGSMSGTRGLMLGRMQTDWRMARLVVPDRTLLEEMSVFARFGPRGKAQAPPGLGRHDDCVMSCAGCCAVAEMEMPAEVEEVDPAEGLTGARYWAAKQAMAMAAGEGEGLNQGIEEVGG